jgi:hypothetical protein
LPPPLPEVAEAWPPEPALEPPSPVVEEVEREPLEPPVARRAC